MKLLFNDSGRPAGTAHVTFSNRGTAQSAIDEKNGQHIGSRYVELSMMN